eukprot:7267243-Prymnesium_polylepis.1
MTLVYGLWCAARRYSSATRLCGASGTRYMTMRGLIGSSGGRSEARAQRARRAEREPTLLDFFTAT